MEGVQTRKEEVDNFGGRRTFLPTFHEETSEHSSRGGIVTQWVKPVLVMLQFVLESWF